MANCSITQVHAREAKLEGDHGVELQVWNIVKSHIEQSANIEKDLLKPADDVQQIIYVTYQQDPDESIKVNAPACLFFSIVICII